MVTLPNVTLLAVSSIKIDETINALQISMDGIDFHGVLLISDQKPSQLPDTIHFKQCHPMKSIDDYSKFMAYDLASYVETDFVLVVQYDGYVIRPQKWNDRFLDYDYIGAPWPKGVHMTKDRVNVRVGNGGFSLRSKKLLTALRELNLPFTHANTGYYNEDGIICNYYRRALEDYGIKFAPVAIASQFSREQDCDDSEPAPFGFHKNRKLIPKLFFVKHFLRKKRKDHAMAKGEM